MEVGAPSGVGLGNSLHLNPEKPVSWKVFAVASKMMVYPNIERTTRNPFPKKSLRTPANPLILYDRFWGVFAFQNDLILE